MINLDKTVQLQNVIMCHAETLSKKLKSGYLVDVRVTLSYISTGIVMLRLEKEKTEIFRASIHPGTDIGELEREIDRLLEKHRTHPSQSRKPGRAVRCC